MPHAATSQLHTHAHTSTSKPRINEESVSSSRIPLLVVSLASTVDHHNRVPFSKHCFPLSYFSCVRVHINNINKYTPRAHFYYHIYYILFSYVWDFHISFLLVFFSFSVFCLFVRYFWFCFCFISMGFYPIHLKKKFGFIRLRKLWNETKILNSDEKLRKKTKKIHHEPLKFNFGQIRISRDKNLFCLIYIRWLILKKTREEKKKNFDYNKHFVFVLWIHSHLQANLNLSTSQ